MTAQATQVLLTEKTYEVDKKDFLHIQDVKKSWYNTTAGFMDTPTNAQPAFIATIVGAGAAWFGLYVGNGHKPSKK